MSSLLREVIEHFGLPENPKTGSIPKEAVIRWMRSDDMEALGALHTYLGNPQYAYRVQPPLELTEYVDFLIGYFERCFREDKKGEWAHTRYGAAWDLASWFGASWQDPQVDRGQLRRIKSWLANLYRQEEEPVKRAIVDGTLEHLFEDQKIAEFFSDWQKDSALVTAYKEAKQWSAKGGSTGLVGSAKVRKK